MAYKGTSWQDHVVDQQTGEVIQQGTPQSATNFNNMEEGILAANELGAVLAQQVAHNTRILADLEGEIGEVVLTNTQEYPFNDSAKTVALTKPRDTLNYWVVVEVISADGMSGDIRIYDKQVNGFKVAFTGSASRATIKYYVQGGMYQ
jgi:hypothetical protein